MTGTWSKGLWDTLLGAFGRAPPYAEAVLDTVLMVALADGPLTLTRRDALSRLVDEEDGPLPRDWSTVEQRIDTIQDDAPLFAHIREQTLPRLFSPEATEFALHTAARISLTDGPLPESTQALFTSIARELGVLDVQDYLRDLTADELARLRYLRAPFNDPTDPRPETLFEAIAESPNDEILRLLVYKLTALRTVLEVRFEKEESRQIEELGTILPTEYGRLRIDGELRVGEGRVFVRVLADEEALYPREAEAITTFAASLQPNDRFILAHAGPRPLAPADRTLGDPSDSSSIERFSMPALKM